MASGLSGACFTPPVTCHNCERKCSDFYQDTIKTGDNQKTDQYNSKSNTGGKRKAMKIADRLKCMSISEENKNKNKESVLKDEDNKVYWRCSGCRFMSYCDETCQLEHWNHVHNYHCAFLSGQKVVEDHNEESCQNCIEKRTSDNEELLNINSPKTGCKVKEESRRMRRALGRMFGFHEIGGDHSCSVEFSCHHPFPMGKIPGKYVCTGLDEMMVHAAKLSNAMLVKTMNDKVTTKETIDELLELHKRILISRLILWRAVLVYGSTQTIEYQINKQFCDITENLNKKFASDNVWWRALAFTTEFICFAFYSQNWSTQDPARIKDTKLLELHDYHKCQIRNISFVSQNKWWYFFKLWPAIVNQSLVLVLPHDVSCATCKADLSGQIVVPDNNSMTVMAPHSVLFPYVSKEGGLIATCAPAKNITCVKDFVANRTNIDMTDKALEEKKVSEAKSRMCQLCMRKSLSAHRCKNCLSVQYCSMECATKDLAFHETVCSTWAKDPTRKLMSAKKQKEMWKSFTEETYQTK